MSAPVPILKDLIILVADLDQENALLGLLGRHQPLNTRRFTYDIRKHPGRDSGCRTQGCDFLRTFSKQYRNAIQLFDHEGSGREQNSAETVQNEMSHLLSINGWGDRACCIVIDPELETWVWSDSSAVDEVLGWTPLADLRGWLRGENWLDSNAIKPNRPKEALHAALKQVGKKPVASLFRKLAQKVSFRNCQDRSFNRLLTALRTWFPADAQEDHQ